MNVDVTRNILTDEVLSRFDLATEEATGLPNACYTSKEWLKAENTRLFAKTWMLAGFCHDIPGKGDACPVDLAGMPLVILRDNDGEIRAFHNVCRHRGAVIVPEKCSAQRMLTCPYHAWAYGLDGSLRSRPHFYGGDNHDTDPGPDAPGLVPVRHAVWHDLIFVNISGDAIAFEEHWKPFTRWTADYDFSALNYAETLDFDVKGNWKLIYENFYDAYHVPAVHPRLEEFSPITGSIGIETEGPWFYNTNPIEEPQEGRGLGMPMYPGLDAVGQRTTWYFHLFPTMAIQIWPDQMAIFQLHAIEPGRTIEHIHMYFIGEAATEPQYAKNRQDVYDMWDELNTEDFLIVENMQGARSSPAFDGGALSPFWDPATQHFAKLVASFMKD
ncbi:MAG: aromatic ring-hydroxylating dioxygenase subunit alpha [Rhodospirillaceae bacterium]|jgi:choline monooxygenase|nr:aromatic ring-hydroxylating dioxygenase subunit alpha [Rhodospirillaceae bacterium]MBT7647045.1 aromatic ring-hydroxylating dioxygenase subunit alpha [Rhodospirillaceae bacterium]